MKTGIRLVSMIMTVVMLVSVSFAASAEETDMIPSLLQECIDGLNELAGDEAYLSAMVGLNEEALQTAATYKENTSNGYISWEELPFGDLMLTELKSQVDLDAMSEAGRKRLCASMYSASLLGNMIISDAAKIDMVLVNSVINFRKLVDADLPSSIYLATCENNTGIIMGIWNNGNGQASVTACFIPTADFFDSHDISELFD